MPLNKDCIRIIRLQPRSSKKHGEEIECSLTHVAFGDRPQYKALSYAWGKSTNTRTILLDGIRVTVGDNLAAALVNIRGLEAAGEEPQAIWIDALCINQSNIEERNRQVRLMPFIYARAQVVLVWLGLGPNITFQDLCREEAVLRTKTTPKHAPKRNILPYPSDLHSSVMKTNPSPYSSDAQIVTKIYSLCRRDYWRRLWIIQEIGKSKHGGLRIHYDSTTIEWDNFIAIIQSQNNLGDSIPLKLDAQRKIRFHGGHTLANLLQNNQHALCQDPRDKIYGFIGLAIDVHESFPMDYSKSLFEVFSDTILFLNSDESRSQHDILGLSRLVNRMLGGALGVEPDGPAQNFDVGWITSKSAPKSGVIRVPGRLVGRVKEIGPMFSDLLAKTEKLNDWTSLIWRNFLEPPTRSTVLEQSELFFEALQVFDEVTQRTIFASDTSITWKEDQQYNLKISENHNGPRIGTDEYISVDSYRVGARLVLLEPQPFNDAPSWIGLAPLGTRPGDLICHIAGIERAVIVRQIPMDQLFSDDPARIPMDPEFPNAPPRNKPLYQYEIVGCAGLARDTATARNIRGADLRPHELFATAPFSPPNQSELFTIYMDVRTAWEISMASA
jgi:hypothetical protein